MLNEAKISRPRPGSWGRDRDRGQGFEVKAEAERGQFLEVEAKAEAKDKVTNKKYQMMIGSI